MVGDANGSVGALRSEGGSVFHLKVRPQSKPPRTKGEALYWRRERWRRGACWVLVLGGAGAVESRRRRKLQVLPHAKRLVVDEVDDGRHNVHPVLLDTRQKRLKPPDVALDVAVQEDEHLAGGSGQRRPGDMTMVRSG